VSLYVFHTDADGKYSATIDDPRAAELNPRLHGVLRTDKNGHYRFETSRPGSYDNQPQHVHYVVKAAGYEPLLLVLQFADDPLILNAPDLKQPMADSWAFQNGPCKARLDCVVTRPVVRDANGASHVTRDIQMVKVTK